MNGASQVAYVVGDIRYLPFKDNSFSFLLSLDAIEHLVYHDSQKALDEFERVTSGYVTVGTPNINFIQITLRKMLFPDSLFDKNPMSKMAKKSPHRHRSEWSKSDLVQHGFKVYGCLGWVTAQRVGSAWVRRCYDLLVWNMPTFAGSLIGFKKVK